MMRSHGVNEGTIELQRKLDAYLHSPGLSVGNKLFFLHFVFLCKLLVYTVTVFFSWYARDARFLRMYTELKMAFVM